MPKKKKKARPQATRVQQPGSKAGRDVIGEQNNHFYAGVEGAASLAAELPAVEAGFTGRTADLARLRAALDPAQAEGAPVVVAAGMGGVGKTQLALTAAHEARREQAFSQALFLDLRGYTTPVNAHRALQSLLVSLGVAEERIPEEEGARAGLYRATLHAQANEHGGPVLVVADNASHPDQVQPLAPGPGGHRLLVTSRERLGSLPARQVKVGTLTDPEAFHVVVADLRLADPEDERVHDLQGLTALAEACAGLPLALRIAAGQLKNAPDLQAGELARTLAHGADRIVHFTDHRELAAVFASSTDRLPSEQAELFTLLGMAPGPDISTAAAAILAGTDEAGALVQLRGLAASHLLTASQGRWSMHDLVAAYAATRTGPHLPSRFPRARRRLLDHYTHRATDAARHLRALPGQEVPNTFTSQEQAWAWLDTERAVLFNTAHTAHRTGHARAAISLPLTLGHYLDRRRLFHDQIPLTRLALDTAQHRGDRTNQAAAWNNLGGALHRVRRFTEALEAHTRARDLYQQLGDVHSEAGAWNNLGNALREVRRFTEALEAYTRARDLYQQLGDVHGEAMAWTGLGNALREVRRFTEALEAYTRARDLYRQTSDAHGAENAGAGVGITLGGLERWQEAVQTLEGAVAFFRQVGDQHFQGRAGYELGLVYHRSGSLGRAVPVLEEAVELLDSTNDPYHHNQAREALDKVRADSDGGQERNDDQD